MEFEHAHAEKTTNTADTAAVVHYCELTHIGYKFIVVEFFPYFDFEFCKLMGFVARSNWFCVSILIKIHCKTIFHDCDSLDKTLDANNRNLFSLLADDF